MLAKRTKKKLFTSYEKKCSFDEFNKKERIKPNERYISFSAGKVTVNVYYDSFNEWAKNIATSEFKIPFGLIIFDENEYQLQCDDITKRTLSSLPKADIYYTFANIIDKYFNNRYDYYYEIEMEDAYLSEELTGHIYYRSPFESCDSCGTCDGARCQTCRKKYIVRSSKSDTIFYEGYNESEAKEELESLKNNYSDIIGDIIEHYKLDMDWLEKEIHGGNTLKDVLKILEAADALYVTI